MELTILHSDTNGLRAGYSCPCGCTPSVEYARDAEVVHEGCCCGNEFAVGPDASGSLTPAPGLHPELQRFESAWGQSLEAAWLVGPSVHGPSSDASVAGAEVVDPVCGMTVEPDAARAKGLHSLHQGVDHFFCGKGCKLEFDEDPEHYLDPTHTPSM